uniref:BPTI/Kunitz inhibitor domain-containing protein n=1 Tax=Ascaris lumbricoides TaxID=6252 RepID=A0A9J2P0E9_ASCLU
MNTFVMLVSCILLPVWISEAVSAQEMLANEICNEYPDRGTCDDRGFQVKWYYDRFAHRCREFFYGGCGGNRNRFDTFQECTNQCHNEPDGMDAERRCSLPHDPGTCNGDFQRWVFDQRTRKCICSWWSGCGGNANRFYSYEHCMSICGKFATGEPSEQSREGFRIEAESRFSQDEAGRQGYFQAPPIQTVPSGYRNLFISGSSSNAPQQRRILVSGITPIIFTRILPPLSFHIRDPQQVRNRSLSTKEIFRLQQLQRIKQKASTERDEGRRVNSDGQQRVMNDEHAIVVSYRQHELSPQQRAQLEARKWRRYKQEQARVLEENYQRRLQAIRARQEALNLQRYNQLYPRDRDSRLGDQQRQQTSDHNQPIEISRDTNLASGNQPQTNVVHARPESQRNVHDVERPELHTNQLDSERLQRAQEESEARRTEAEAMARQTEEEAQVRRTETGTDGNEAGKGQMSQAEANARAYDARQLEYYRQLQEHRRKYVEQVRQHQLQERERQLRYREELIRHQQSLEAARALATQRRQLALAYERGEHSQTVGTVQQWPPVQPSPGEEQPGHEQRRQQQEQPPQEQQQQQQQQQEQQEQAQTDNTSRSRIASTNLRIPSGQEIRQYSLQEPRKASFPYESATERRTDGEVQRAVAKTRKRIRFEKLKKLERMGLLPLPAPTTTKVTTTVPSVIVQSLEEESEPTVVQVSSQRKHPSLASSHSKSSFTQTAQAGTDRTPAYEGRALTHEEEPHIHQPDSSRAHAAWTPLKQAKKLGAEIVRPADKVAEEEEVTRSEVIKADEKTELLDNGKQILSLDDYDDELIEEEYYVDEYGRRLTEEEEANRRQKAEEAILMTSPDPQAEPFIAETPTVSLMTIHASTETSEIHPPSVPADMATETSRSIPHVSATKVYDNIEPIPLLSASTLPYEESQTVPLDTFGVTPLLVSAKKGETQSVSGSLLSENNETASAIKLGAILINTAKPALRLLSSTELPSTAAETVASSVTPSEQSSVSATTWLPTSTSLPLPHSDQPQSWREAAIGANSTRQQEIKGHAEAEDDKEKNAINSTENGEQETDEEEYDDSEDLFFWKPEYESKRLQKTVKDEQSNEDEGKDESQNAFRIKIHNKGVMTRR